MSITRRVLFLAALLGATNAWGQASQRDPHIGYLYPDGGQRGSTFEVVAGGQRLNGVKDVYVSGEGVHASVKYYVRPSKPLEREQRQELLRRLKERYVILTREGRGLAPLQKGPAQPGPDKTPAPVQEAAALPNHPLLQSLDKLNLVELEFVADEFLKPRKRQANVQIAERLLIEVAIDSGAAPGDRELRLGTPAGLTNPMCFQVGTQPEVREREPLDPRANVPQTANPPIALPAVLNGQIMPGDVDRFRFQARRGQQLVFDTQARRLIPYLADAVPGWFQATLALYDAKGNEVAFDDDYRFDPDPVLFYQVPDDGEYALEIRDSIFRGREDFVYRIAVGEQPFITRTFPLGGREGVATVASIAGWNLPRTELPLDTQPGEKQCRETVMHMGAWITNGVPYAVNALPERDETEPNDTSQGAQQVALPQIVNGRIAQADDVDTYRFDAHAGDEVVAEVYARRLNSPLDSLLRLTDASGKVLAWNDDFEEQESGLLTHHADSYLSARLPEDGSYCVELSDSQHHGDESYGYRLRIGPPQPDFALRVTPSSINVRAGRSAAICVHVLRKDGFDGEIELVLKDAPAGFTLDGARIPSGHDRIRMTLTAHSAPAEQPVVLRLEGRAQIDGQTVTRTAVPSEDMMQAFMYRHLVPSQELMVAVSGPQGRVPPIEVAGNGPVRIPAGGTAQVLIKTPKLPVLQDIQLELSEPPQGVTLQEVTVVPQGLAFLLKADSGGPQPGYVDNVIVEAFTQRPGRQNAGKAATQNQRVSLGVLPAIPIELVP